MPAGREALWADLALVLVTALWGSTFIVNRLVLESTPPLLFLALRFGLAAAVLTLFAWRRPRTAGLFRDGAILGALLAVGIGFQLAGQLFTTASKAAFITGLSVPLTPVVGFFATRKLPTIPNVVGLALAAGGFGLLSWPKDAAGLQTGDVLVLVTALVYAYIVVFLAETAPKHDSRRYAAVQVAFAAVGVVVARLAVTPFLSRPEAFFAAEARPLPRTWALAAAVAWMVLAATVVTFALQTWAQARMSAAHAAVLFALEPVFTALFAAAILHERMSGREAWGAGLVLAGIVVSELPSGRK